MQRHVIMPLFLAIVCTATWLLFAVIHPSATNHLCNLQVLWLTHAFVLFLQALIVTFSNYICPGATNSNWRRGSERPFEICDDVLYIFDPDRHLPNKHRINTPYI